jgi:hypothetical protein
MSVVTTPGLGASTKPPTLLMHMTPPLSPIALINASEWLRGSVAAG